MNKFIYQANEMQIADTQCALCNHLNVDEKCQIYELIPEKVSAGDIKCESFQKVNKLQELVNRKKQESASAES